MKFNSILNISLLIFISSCNEIQSNKLSLVCSGIETTNAGRNNSEKSEPETRNIIKTIILEKENRKVIKGSKILKDINGPEQGDRTEEFKNLYILKIDSLREIYEQSIIDIFYGKTNSYDSGLTVSNEKISGSSELSVTWENRNNENYSESFSIEIDRISGAYKERLRQSFQSGKEVFFVETVGNCHKAEKKF